MTEEEDKDDRLRKADLHAIQQSQQGQGAQHVGNHACIHDHSQRGDARDGRMAGLMFFVDEFVDQDEDRTGEGHDATRPGPRIDPAEQEVHGEEPAPRREEHGQCEVDEGGQGQLSETCCSCVRHGCLPLQFPALSGKLGEGQGEGGRLFLLAVETHAGPSFEVCELAADETGVVDEPVAHGTAFPASLEHGGVAIQDLIAHPAVLRLDAQEQGFPFARAVPDTHGEKV